MAVSISGKAKVGKERMDLADTDSAIELEIEDVKIDLIPGTKIETGITYSVAEEMKSFIQEYIVEVQEKGCVNVQRHGRNDNGAMIWK